MSNGSIHPDPGFPLTRLSAALRLVAQGDRLRVSTGAAQELRGRFQRLAGDALVLLVPGMTDTEAEIPAATIRGITRIRHCALRGAVITGGLATLPFLWLASWFSGVSDPRMGKYGMILAVAALVVVGAAAGIGALIGLAFDRDEPLLQAHSAPR